MSEQAKEIKEKLNKVYIGHDELYKICLDKKGYMFDSLVYRFKNYQSRAFPYEVIQLKHDRNLSEIEAMQKIKERHDRDLMRFIEILNEAIGEHN